MVVYVEEERMGVFQTVLDEAKTFGPRSRVAHELRMRLAIGDDDPADAQPADEVQQIATWLDSYTKRPTAAIPSVRLTFTLANGETFTTDYVGYNSTTGTVQSAINTAATAAGITDWTNGDIAVSGSTWNLGAMVFTYDGDSVSGQGHPVFSIDTLGLFVDYAGGTNAVLEAQAGNAVDTPEIQAIGGWCLDPEAGSTYSLAFSLDGDGPVTITFTVEDIPFDATAAELEALIDAAAVAAGYSAWSGEVSVAAIGGGTKLTDSDGFTFTFGDGLLVQYANHDLMVADFSGFNIPAAYDPDNLPITRSTPGQTYRPVWGILRSLGIVGSPVPIQGSTGADSAGFTEVVKGGNADNLQPWFIRELAQAAAFEDNQGAIYDSIINAMGWADKAPLLP